MVEATSSERNNRSRKVQFPSSEEIKLRMAASDRDEESSEWQSLMPTFDCHFNWCDFNLRALKGNQVTWDHVKSSPFLAIDYYNLWSKKYPVRRFAVCLHAAYITFYFGKDDEKVSYKLLLTAYRILEHSRDPTSPPPPTKLPTKSFSDSLWGLPDDQFFAECEKLTGEESDGELTAGSGSDEDELTAILPNMSKTVASDIELDDSDEDDDDKNVPFEGTLGLWNEDRFTGMHEGAKHVADSLKVMMMFSGRPRTPREKFENIPAYVTPINQMTEADCALIRYVEAWSWRMLRSKNNYVKAMGGTVLADPSDVKWYLVLLETLAGIRIDRHLDWGRKVEWKDVFDFLDAIDAVLDLSPPPWMVLEMNFERLQAINDYMVSSQRTMPYEESQKLFHVCINLCKKIIESTSEGDYLAYCAQFLSRRSYAMDLALTTIEKAVAEARGKETEPYINAKACNIFVKVKRYEDALACAERAATEAFGSNWQILEVKTLLGHEIVPKEFFETVRKRCKLSTHVEQFHVSAFLYYVCKTKDINSAISHIKKVVGLAKLRPSKKIMGDIFCKWINADVYLAEAFHITVLYVLNGDYKDDEIELTDETLETCSKLKIKLEESYLKDRALTRLTPKEYMKWLRDPKSRKHTSSEGAERSFFPHQKYMQGTYWRQGSSNQSKSDGGWGNNYRGTGSGYSSGRNFYGGSDSSNRRTGGTDDGRGYRGSNNSDGGYRSRGNTDRESGYRGSDNNYRGNGNADGAYGYRGSGNAASGYSYRSTERDSDYRSGRNPVGDECYGGTSKAGRNGAKPEKLSWRSEMRPNTNECAENPVSPSESKQPSRSWQDRTSGNRTNPINHSNNDKNNAHESNDGTTRGGPHRNVKPDWRRNLGK